jgi:hypothetical protein
VENPETNAVVESAQKTAGATPQKDVLGGPIFLVWNQIDIELKVVCLDFIKKQESIIPKLNVFVCSFGGDPDVAFNSVNILRTKCKKLVMFIPDNAKSAATLLCLGADEIVMALGAQLGPLDMQVQDPRNSPENISALSGYQALEAVANFLHTEIDVTVKQLYRKARTNIRDSLSYAMKLVDSMARPLFEQVNPLDLGYFSNSLAVSEKYGVELLCRYKQKSEIDAKQIVSCLVRNYPSHSFIIDLLEAQKIGLSAREPNADESRIMDEIYARLLKDTALQKHGALKY